STTTRLSGTQPTPNAVTGPPIATVWGTRATAGPISGPAPAKDAVAGDAAAGADRTPAATTRAAAHRRPPRPPASGQLLLGLGACGLGLRRLHPVPQAAPAAATPAPEGEPERRDRQPGPRQRPDRPGGVGVGLVRGDLHPQGQAPERGQA